MSVRMVSGILVFVGLLVSIIAYAQSPFEAELARIQEQWAVVNYQIKSQQEKLQAFETLSARAHRLSTENPGRAEPLIWEGIVLSTYGGAKGGLGALSLAKRARAVLEAALQIDDKALDGSAYSSLGTLYARVPGFPLGFGDDDKAQDLLMKALAIDPDSLDANYFYALYLCDRRRCHEALRYLQRAVESAPRSGRELADEGMRREVRELMAKAR